MCNALTKSGKPCKKSPTKEYCYIHLKAELDDKKIKEKHTEKRISILCTKLADCVIELGNKDTHILTLKDQLDIAKFEIEQLKADLEDFNYIRRFESLYQSLKQICETDELRIINQHLTLSYNTKDRIQYLFHMFGIDTQPLYSFNIMRKKRNDLAHSKIENI